MLPFTQISFCLLNILCLPTSERNCWLRNSAIHSYKYTRDLFYWYGSTLIPAWISNHMRSKVWDKITYPLPNFIGATVEVWEWIKKFHPTHYNGCNYLSMLGSKLIHVTKGAPGRQPVAYHAMGNMALQSLLGLLSCTLSCNQVYAIY